MIKHVLPGILCILAGCSQKQEPKDAYESLKNGKWVLSGCIVKPLVNGKVDLGAIATEFVLLGIDPYPRKPDAVFEPPPVGIDPEEHPFAALKALQGAPKPRKPGESDAWRLARAKQDCRVRQEGVKSAGSRYCIGAKTRYCRPPDGVQRCASLIAAGADNHQTAAERFQTAKIRFP